MASIANHLVTASANLSPLEVLHAPPAALLGVSPAAAAALATLDVHTVFDLASSRVFANAAQLVDAGRDPRTVLARFGLAPADVIDVLPPGVTVEQLQFQPIHILEGIGPVNAASLSAALHVAVVRDLALWPPYLAAKEILSAVFFPDGLPGVDPDAPADLLPKSGEYPTERVFYSTLVFDGFDGQAVLTPLEAAGQVNLSKVAGADFGFKRPGIGALLTMAQSWYAQGVALGQLLHSVALAPGESTRIAMLDWSRRTAGRQAEDVTETEALSNVTEHSRALSEVTSAVAQEAQSGFSDASVNSVSAQRGGAGGFSLGPITLGDSSGSARSSSRAMSFSSSTGRRDLSASMNQNVVDRTQQHANATRNRRATVVREVSQQEHETVSTRVVTNYNHMHALSIQYYEVVQIYRVSVQVVRVEKCLFVPMLLVDFKNATLVRMFRAALLAAAVDPAGKTLLSTDFDTVVVKSETGSKLGVNNPFGVAAESRDAGKALALPDEAKLVQIVVFRGRGGINDLPQLANISIKLRDGTVAEIERGASSTTTRDDMKVVSRVPLREIASITMTNTAAAGTAHDYLFDFQCSFKGQNVGFGSTINVPPGPAVTVLTFTGGGIWDRLIAHLEANRLHYSQAVYEALDPATVTLLLSEYSYGGQPLSVLVDPQPVTTAGNYLVFRTHVTPDAERGNADEKAWAEWLEQHGVKLGHPKEDLVPLPSGGVFAEAVLGRYNSAEKLDLTRFWNWQDSPIPIQAPEIAPVQLGSRAETEDLKAGPFSQPLVNIVSPTSLPEPTGLAAALQAIANGNMFRDMSGLAATVGLAQAGLQTTSDAATAANVQAGSNLATAAKKEVEMFKAALAFAAAAMGAGSADTSPSTISNEGAKINHGRSLDQRGVAPSAGGGAGAASQVTGGGGSAGSTGGAPGAAAGRSVSGAASHEESAFRKALWGQQGQSQSDTAKSILGFALDGGAAGAAGAPALDAGSFAPFVSANRLDLEIADLLRALDTYPADSWAKQIAAFAHHELDVGNLFGIFSSANVAKAKALIPASFHAQADTMAATIGNGVTQAAIGGPGAYKGFTLIAETLVRAGVSAGPGRQRLAQVLTHELTHFRNRDFFNAFGGQPVSANPSYYVDLAKANAHAGTPATLAYVMGEVICNHVAWRVQQDLQHKATGAAVPAHPSKKGFFRYALALDGGGWPDNGYLADLKAASTYNRQIAEWLLKVGGDKALFHDDPGKNTAVRQFFKDTHAEVQPAFAKPAEPEDGGV